MLFLSLTSTWTWKALCGVLCVCAPRCHFTLTLPFSISLVRSSAAVDAFSHKLSFLIRALLKQLAYLLRSTNLGHDVLSSEQVCRCFSSHPFLVYASNFCIFLIWNLVKSVKTIFHVFFNHSLIYIWVSDERNSSSILDNKSRIVPSSLRNMFIKLKGVWGGGLVTFCSLASGSAHLGWSLW